ncbi:Ig-like domain-containing protein [Methanobrevibacter sp. UBA212]|uniref:Ig-like domain-containing protein n=1 Tax=Methanobrevibacter sp. UBA212 TaxID=1915476 RepID=UPI0025EC5E0A|nr:Ig-like domain-containing protein [Methanobrevibacter sp. UBA212]
MKFKNEITVICLICFILINIASVSAEDNNTNIITETNNDYDDNLSLNTENEILSDTGSFEDLNALVNSGSSTVELDRNYIYTSSFNDGKGIVISQNNTIIDGKGHTIDGNGQSRIFNVTGTAVTLRNIVFANGFAIGSSGGAIYGYGDNLRVINCTFINNTASNWGGAVYSYPDSYTVFYNSSFINNKADNGGALATIYGYRHDILNCIFDSNTANRYGGALIIYGTLANENRPWNNHVNIKGSLFVNNEASNGSAISNYVSAYINMTNSIVLGEPTNVIDSWGAMFFADYNWWGNTYDNKSVKPGITNQVRFTKWLYMDVIVDSGDTDLTVSINNLYDDDSTIASIHSATNLPAINVDLKGTNITLTSNNITLDSTGVAKVSYIINDIATITASYNDVNVTKTINFGSFSALQELIRNARNNTIITLDRDYVYSAGDTITKGIVISYKNNITIDGKGHTVNAAGKSRVFVVNSFSRSIVIKNLKIVNGNCNGGGETDFGAGMVWQSPNGRLMNCSFINNHANGLTGGGALYWSGSNGYVTDCSFINNTHDYSVGGAVYWYESGAHIINSVFENNAANSVEGSGGAIYVFRAGANIIDCNFTDNRAKYGGAIYDNGYTSDVVSSIENCIFKANVAIATDSKMGGGAICANYISIANSIFLENEAKDGAAVFCLYGGNIDKSVFINNTAPLNGVVFWYTNGKISNSIFLNNNGEAICNVFGGLDANDNWYGTVWNNHANMPDVDNRANVTKWIFLNATDPIYDKDSGSFVTQFNFMEYDDSIKTISSYDSSKLPHISLKLSSQNLTIIKNDVELGETIEGTTTYFMGNLVAEYENVRYILPFKYQKMSWIEANQSIIKNIGKTSYLSYTIRPYHEDVTPFLTEYLTFQSSDSSIVKVDNQGKITTMKAGTANITIKYSGCNLKGDYEYLPSNITITVNVIRTQTNIELIYEVDSLNVSDSGSFIASVRPGLASGGVTYACNDTQVLRVDSNGYYKALSSGVALVTVTYAGNANYEPSQLNFTVKVNRKPTSIDDNDIDWIDLDLNNDHLIYVYLNPSQAGQLKCVSNNTDIATAEFEYGICRVSATGQGLAKVTIYFEGNNEYEPSSVDVIVKVSAVQTKINVNETLNLYRMDTGILPFTITPNYSFNLVFTSNDTNVIRFLDNYGQYETVGNGIANVTIDLIGYGKYLSSSASMIVTVESIETNILVNSSFDLHVGEIKNIGAKLNPKVGNLIYESNDTSVININDKGYMNAMKEGVAKITVSYPGVERYLPSNATVIVTVQKGSTRIDVADEIEVYNKNSKYIGVRLISEWQNAPISGALEYRCNDTDILTIGNYGRMTGNRLGLVEVTINFNETDKYLASSKTVLVRVVLEPTEINAPSEIILLDGETDNINATLNHINGKLNYFSDNTSVVTVDNNGNIVACGIGKANITITYNETERYASAIKTVAIEVVESKVQTNISANETIYIYVGNSTNIGATISPISALLNGNFIYVVENPEILEIDENGNIKGLKVGNTAITISYNENSRFLANSTTVHVNVLIIPSEIVAPDNISLNVTESVSIAARLITPAGGQLIYVSNDEEIVTVDENGLIAAHKIGSTNITVKYAGNENYTASSKTVEVNVVAVSTVIEVNDNVEMNLSERGKINPKLIPYAKGKLNYTSSNMSVVTVNEYGVLVAIGVGEANITVSFAGEGKYLPSSTIVHVKVTAVETSIDINGNFEINRTERLYVGGVVIPYSSGKLTYSSTNETVVSVNERGRITANEFGEADIIVSFAGEGKYLPSTAYVHIKVVGVESTITADEYIEVDAGSQNQISASLSPNNSGRLTFNSNDSSIVSINQNGIFNALKIGVANITISYAGEGKYLPVIKNVIIRVKGLKSEIDVDDKISANPFDTFNINASLTPSSGKLNYASNDSSIVSVDEYGKVTVHKAGLAKISVSFNGDDIYLPVEVDVEINSTKLQPKIEFISDDLIQINGSQAIIQIGFNGYIDFELNYKELRNNLTFNCNDTNVISMDDTFIQTLSGGTAEITVSYAGNERYEQFSEKLTVKVTKRITQIKVKDNITLSVEDIQKLDAHIVDQSGIDLNLNLVYSIDCPDIITLKDGKITALKKGTARITITFNETKVYSGSSATVNVTVIAKATKITTDVENIYLEVFENSTIYATLNYPDDGQIKFKSNDESIATVDNNGKVCAVGQGVATITVSYEGCEDYLPSQANVAVRVSAIPTSISVVGFTPVIKGNTIVLNATLNPNVGDLVYSSGDSSIAYVDSQTGRITGINTGTTFVNVEFKGNKQYARSIKQVTVQVILDATSISVNDHVEIEVGHRINLNATLMPSQAGYLIYSSNNENIAAVDSNGFLQGRSEGMTIITVRFEGNPQYLACEQKVTVYVNKDASSVQFDVGVEEDGKDTTYSINLSKDAQGTFTVFVDGKEYQTKTLIEGKATINVDGMSPGDHEITLKYSGDNKYAAVTQKKTVHIKEVKFDKNNDVSAIYTATAKYSVQLKIDTQVVAGKTVTFKVKGKTYYARTDSNGFASISVKLPAGKYAVTAEYKGVKVTNKIIFNHIIIAKNLKVKKSSKYKKINIKLNKVNNKVLKGKKVVLKFKGKKYKAKTNKKGIAIFKLKKNIYSNLEVGKKYKYTVIYGKDKVTKKIKIKK